MTRTEIAVAIQLVSSEEFSRSGGPGGQNVNKVNTQVTLRVPLAALVRELPLTEVEAAELEAGLTGRVNAAGEFILQVSDTRSQRANRDIAVERATEAVLAALQKPLPRRPTRPGRAVRERRIAGKKHRARIKHDRRPPEE
jgi:ribosome-associated protein